MCLAASAKLVSAYKYLIIIISDHFVMSNQIKSTRTNRFIGGESNQTKYIFAESECKCSRYLMLAGFHSKLFLMLMTQCGRTISFGSVAAEYLAILS